MPSTTAAGIANLCLFLVFLLFLSSAALRCALAKQRFHFPRRRAGSNGDDAPRLRVHGGAHSTSPGHDPDLDELDPDHDHEHDRRPPIHARRRRLSPLPPLFIHPRRLRSRRPSPAAVQGEATQRQQQIPQQRGRKREQGDTEVEVKVKVKAEDRAKDKDEDENGQDLGLATSGAPAASNAVVLRIPLRFRRRSFPSVSIPPILSASSSDSGPATSAAGPGMHAHFIDLHIHPSWDPDAHDPVHLHFGAGDAIWREEEGGAVGPGEAGTLFPSPTATTTRTNSSVQLPMLGRSPEQRQQWRRLYPNFRRLFAIIASVAAVAHLLSSAWLRVPIPQPSRYHLRRPTADPIPPTTTSRVTYSFQPLSLPDELIAALDMFQGGLGPDLLSTPLVATATAASTPNNQHQQQQQQQKQQEKGTEGAAAGADLANRTAGTLSTAPTLLRAASAGLGRLCDAAQPLVAYDGPVGGDAHAEALARLSAACYTAQEGLESAADTAVELGWVFLAPQPLGNDDREDDDDGEEEEESATASGASAASAWWTSLLDTASWLSGALEDVREDMDGDGGEEEGQKETLPRQLLPVFNNASACTAVEAVRMRLGEDRPLMMAVEAALGHTEVLAEGLECGLRRLEDLVALVGSWLVKVSTPPRRQQQRQPQWAWALFRITKGSKTIPSSSSSSSSSAAGAGSRPSRRLERAHRQTSPLLAYVQALLPLLEQTRAAVDEAQRRMAALRDKLTATREEAEGLVLCCGADRQPSMTTTTTRRKKRRSRNEAQDASAAEQEEIDSPDDDDDECGGWVRSVRVWLPSGGRGEGVGVEVEVQKTLFFLPDLRPLVRALEESCRFAREQQAAAARMAGLPGLVIDVDAATAAARDQSEKG